mmetsp:Transcript_6320/g.11260  ORF Transcript_6320/g.11260 Transcript_6320/m.11260 type:complete len:112 (-) Transcript_6320:126-461(-)
MNVGMKYLRFEDDRGGSEGVVRAATDGETKYSIFVGCVDRSFDESGPVEEGGGGGWTEVNVGIGIAIAGGFFEGLEFFPEAFGGTEIVSYHLYYYFRELLLFVACGFGLSR